VTFLTVVCLASFHYFDKYLCTHSITPAKVMSRAGANFCEVIFHEHGLVGSSVGRNAKTANHRALTLLFISTPVLLQGGQHDEASSCCEGNLRCRNHSVTTSPRAKMALRPSLCTNKKFKFTKRPNLNKWLGFTLNLHSRRRGGGHGEIGPTRNERANRQTTRFDSDGGGGHGPLDSSLVDRHSAFV
jgi:hypothetical protein